MSGKRHEIEISFLCCLLFDLRPSVKRLFLMTKLQKEKPRGNQDGEEPDFSDPEDFVDHVSDHG